MFWSLICGEQNDVLFGMQKNILSGVTTDFFKLRRLEYLNITGNFNVPRMENDVSEVVNYRGMLNSGALARHGLSPQQL
jgi:hypothetical protein